MHGDFAVGVCRRDTMCTVEKKSVHLRTLHFSNILIRLLIYAPQYFSEPGNSRPSLHIVGYYARLFSSRIYGDANSYTHTRTKKCRLNAHRGRKKKRGEKIKEIFNTGVYIQRYGYTRVAFEVLRRSSLRFTYYRKYH